MWLLFFSLPIKINLPFVCQILTMAFSAVKVKILDCFVVAIFYVENFLTERAEVSIKLAEAPFWDLTS
jgi:hypothetical protein